MSDWKFKYYFTLEPELVAVPVGEIPGGFRVDLRYRDGVPFPVYTEETSFTPEWVGPGPVQARLRQLGLDPAKVTFKFLMDERKKKDSDPNLDKLREKGVIEWFGIEGRVLSGSDWATVREDGVVTFDGRATIQTSDEKPFLVDMVVSGVADLRKAGQGLGDRKARRRVNGAFDDWLQGRIDYPINAALAVRFEAAGAEEHWAAASIQDASSGFWKYEQLVRGQFVAIGSFDVKEERYSPIRKLKLKVYEIRPPEPVQSPPPPPAPPSPAPPSPAPPSSSPPPPPSAAGASAAAVRAGKKK